MTKLELAIQSIEWKIERTEKEYREARAALTRELNNEEAIFRPVFVKQYADRMDEAYKKLLSLNEQLETLKRLAE